MERSEAAQVLGVEREAGLKDIGQRYGRLFEANDPKKGGSLYLQAKVWAARRVLEEEALKRGERWEEGMGGEGEERGKEGK